MNVPADSAVGSDPPRMNRFSACTVLRCPEAGQGCLCRCFPEELGLLKIKPGFKSTEDLPLAVAFSPCEGKSKDVVFYAFALVFSNPVPNSWLQGKRRDEKTRQNL